MSIAGIIAEHKELRATIEAALRIEPLWGPRIADDPQHADENLALDTMLKSFRKLVASERGKLIACSEKLPPLKLGDFTSPGVGFLVSNVAEDKMFFGHYHTNGWFYEAAELAEKKGRTMMAWGRPDAVGRDGHSILGVKAEGPQATHWCYINEPAVEGEADKLVRQLICPHTHTEGFGCSDCGVDDVIYTSGRADVTAEVWHAESKKLAQVILEDAKTPSERQARIRQIGGPHLLKQLVIIKLAELEAK